MENRFGPLQLTRAELFDRVWTTPVIRLAEEFGITNFVLAGICRKHQIPTPGAGYWSRVAHGKGGARPELGGDRTALIDIGRIRTPGFRSSRPKSRTAGTIERNAAAGSSPDPTTHEMPHPKAAKTVARLRSAKAEDRVRVAGPGCFSVLASPATADRVECVLSRLLSATDHRGWVVTAGPQGLGLNVDGEPISFELIEATDRVPHVLTEKERRAIEAYDARAEKARRTGAYVSTWDKPRIPEWDYLPNGKLSLVLEEKARWRGVRRTFSDRKTQRVETLIDCIVEALSGYAAEAKRRRVEDEKARIRAEEEHQRREVQKRLAQIDERRVEFAERQVARLERLSRWTRLVDHLGDGELPAETDRFRAWLRGHVGVLRADLTPEALEGRLAATRLMHDDAVTSSWIDVETGAYRTAP